MQVQDPTYEAHNLLVLNFLGFVDVLSCQGGVLLRMACGEGIDGCQNGAHEVGIMGKSCDCVFHKDWESAVPPEGLIPPLQFLLGRQLSILQQVGHLRRDERIQWLETIWCMEQLFLREANHTIKNKQELKVTILMKTLVEI